MELYISIDPVQSLYRAPVTCYLLSVQSRHSQRGDISMVIQETTRSPCLTTSDHNGVETEQPEEQQHGLEDVVEARVGREVSSDTSGTSDEEPEENDLNR